MYTYQEKAVTLLKYEETQSNTATIHVLGYPSKETLYNWIDEKGRPTKKKAAFRGVNTQEHTRHPYVELKLEVQHRCFELGKDVKSVSDEIGYSRASIYAWRRKYIRRGTIALMNPNDDSRGELTEGVAFSSEEIDAIKAEMQDMQMQIDILKETINVLKRTQLSIKRLSGIGRRQ